MPARDRRTGGGLVYLPYIYTGSGASYTPIAIARAMAQAGRPPMVFLPSAIVRPPDGVRFAAGLPMILPRVLRRGRLDALATPRIEARLMAELRRRGPGTTMWLWPNARPAFVRALKDAGAFLIREMINTHRGTARTILDAEATRVGCGPIHEISEASIAAETAELALCDRIVSPSEAVDASMAEFGVPPEKLIRSRFGWDPARLAGTTAAPRTADGVLALFVGEISIRKGAHLALSAWERAGLPGEFRLVGKVHPAMAELVARHVATGRVSHVPFTPDVAAQYRAADFLFFPTLEEGAPLVCYEAAGCGLPILTGPMGRARVVEDGKTGLIVDPHDEDALVAALRRLGGDPGMRAAMGKAAALGAAASRWEEAALERLAAIA